MSYSMLRKTSPDATSPMSLIAAQGEPTALDQLGNAAEDCNIPNQEHMAQRDAFQAHEAQGQDGVAPEKREMGLHSEASRSIGINISRTQRRVLSITDLPLEVLRGVFEFFQHPATVGQSINLELIEIGFGVDQLKDI
uniref:Uncharacterized protein n=1 Tax=Bionectria ochroleuca TaxID=29856 RepID=A0A8H7TP44_BIOOC